MTEEELKALFKDCETGAVPALSNAYGLKVIWDDQLKHASDIYIEAGDHAADRRAHAEGATPPPSTWPLPCWTARVLCGAKSCWSPIRSIHGTSPKPARLPVTVS